MCKQCKGHQAAWAAHGRRRKLWEIEDSYRCSIVGTCVTGAELRKLAAKAKVQFAPAASEYEVHGFFVQAAKDATVIARFLQKALDRKFRAAVDRVRAMKTEKELRAFWDRSLEKGDIAGPYWALMTYAAASPDLMRHAYGEVHMLSHLMGASNRADIGRLTASRHRVAAIEKENTRVRWRLVERDNTIRDLNARLSLAVGAQKRLEDAEARLRALHSDGQVKALQNGNDDLCSRLARESRRADAAERRFAEQKRKVDALQSEGLRREAALQKYLVECETLEEELRTLLARDVGEGGEMHRGGKSGNLDLAGSNILYVGGRANLAPHFRTLVERHNGKFIHHDGGLEDSGGRLADLLGRADAILCPTDCVSHAACLRAKKFCKRCAKPFVLLRSSGLSSFTSGLREIAVEMAGPDARSSGF